MIDFIRSFQKQFLGKRGAPAQALSAKTPAASLSLAYIAALGIIAVLTIGCHILTAHITSKQKEGFEIAHRIGRQDALTKDIIVYANKYLNLNDKLSHDFLTQAIGQMQQGQVFLTQEMGRTDLLGRPLSPELYNIYFNKPHHLEQRINIFIFRAQEFAELKLDEIPKVRQMVLEDLMKLAEPLTSALDVTLDHYQTGVQEKTDHYYTLQLYGVIFVLLVLMVEAIFIFRPLVRRVDDYHQMLLRYALEDSLTGLNNRRAFMKRATAELRRAQREKETAVVVLSDLDKFKSINDTYGHKVGDLVLQHYAAQLQELLRAGDIVGRIGGEEFAMVLPKTPGQTGFQTIDRLREKIAHTPCPYVDEAGTPQMLTYTSSFGLVVVEPGAFCGIDELLARADGGLYEAKHRGRNCVVQVTPGDAPVAAALQA